MRYPLLSFLEIGHYVRLCQGLLERRSGPRVERVFVPESSFHPQGYFKNEWAMDLYHPDGAYQLYFSLRAQQCGFLLLSGRALRPAKHPSRSGFDLSLSKHLVGAKLTAIKSMDTERRVDLEFESTADSTEGYRLPLILLPAQPDAFLIQKDDEETVLASVRGKTGFSVPPARELTTEQIAKIPFRKEWVASLQAYEKLWFDTERAHAFEIRKQRAESLIAHQKQNLEKKLASLQEQLTQSEAEPDWNAYGSLMQTHFYSNPKPSGGFYQLMDYEREQEVRIPADPKLNPKQQMEKFFHLAKRNRTRLSETSERMESLRTKLAEADARMQALAAVTDLDSLLPLELALGLQSGGKAPASKDQKKLAGFSGKQFTSKEGLTILVGRNLAENLELTFKIARGNDLWLHVKGRPGSHAVILLPPKRTASLDTLLDAAHLCIVYSGGRDWGKTDVDYTFRKHVKKIKNQTEVSYTHNKTLSVAIDPERLKRLNEEN